MKPTSVSATELELPAVMEVIIEKGEKAAFDGVLVPEESYRFYNRKVLESEELSRQYEELQISASQSSTSTYVAFAFGGIVLGFVASQYFMHNRLK